MEMMSLPTLVEAVRQRSADSPLDRIATALMISEELTSSADDLIGHFVADARQAGCSWTEIGHRIGVSKQAARQRFGQRLPAAGENGPERQPRLLACLAAAGRAAAADGAAEIGTHHQLTGLFQAGIAAGQWPPGTDPALQARLFIAGLYGLMAQWHLAPGSFSWDHAAAALAGD